MKNTFLESPVIVLQHIKNSAWTIEKMYSKTCVRKGFLSIIYTTITMVTQAQAIFTRVQTKFKAQKNALVHGFT